MSERGRTEVKFISPSPNVVTDYTIVGNGQIRRHFGIFSETML